MSYISALNLLEDPSSNLSEEALREELALWTNAQFTFDVQPNSESKPMFSDLYTPNTPIVLSHPAINENTKSKSKKSTSHVVEDDKKKRNTAASARFRLKKKQKEYALEQKTKEMELKARYLENRVDELEKEAAWLRALVLEKRRA